ncbi:FAD-dependent oxidoreductase [Ruminococcaceae bacterium OttesenSCG-928-L11]|nr:FAD-dependent oxidoreductase [Ruminococcaceae bacterium OttesenSCG-928-L11]
MAGQGADVADFLIVGSGAAALGAACTALGAGASVIVLEKADRLGGTTARSGGGFWIPCNSKQQAAGWKDSPRDALRYMARYSYPNRYDPEASRYGLSAHQYELLERFVSNAAPMADRLEALGALRSGMEINWTGKPQVDYMDHLPENRAVRGRSLYPVDEQGNQGMGAEMIRQLEGYVRAKGGAVFTGHRVTELVMEQGRAVGLVAQSGGSSRRFAARRGIIFGSGGYSHDPALMASLQRGPHYGGCAVPTNTGDFIRIAGAVGAAIGNTAGAFRAQSMIDAYLANPGGSSNVFYIPGDSVILVNKYGKRVVDEKRNYTDRAMVHFVWDAGRAEWANLLTFMVFDSRTAALWQGYPPYPVQGGEQPDYLLRADTLPALAEAIGARLARLAPHTGGFALADNFAAALEQTVEQFNAYAARGVDPEFHRGKSAYDREWTTFPPTVPDGEWPARGTDNYTMHPFRAQGPYYAIVLAAGTLDTNGGPVVNGNAQVLDWNDRPIPGLYGAGNCIASPTANAYWGAGSTLGPALTYGYIAVNHALGLDGVTPQ